MFAPRSGPLSRLRNRTCSHRWLTGARATAVRSPTIIAGSRVKLAERSGFFTGAVSRDPSLSNTPMSGGKELQGSCHCGAVRFTVKSSTPVPYQLCLCSICRKVGGCGGSINLGADSGTLNISQGKEHVSVYNAVMDRDTKKERVAHSERSFCSKCSTMLWVFDKDWPELIHPFASAIDTPLDPPDEMVCLLLNSAPGYVRLPEGKKQTYEGYPPLSLADWHKKHNKLVE